MFQMNRNRTEHRGPKRNELETNGTEQNVTEQTLYGPDRNIIEHNTMGGMIISEVGNGDT